MVPHLSTSPDAPGPDEASGADKPSRFLALMGFAGARPTSGKEESEEKEIEKPERPEPEADTPAASAKTEPPPPVEPAPAASPEPPKKKGKAVYPAAAVPAKPSWTFPDVDFEDEENDSGDEEVEVQPFWLQELEREALQPEKPEKPKSDPAGAPVSPSSASEKEQVAEKAPEAETVSEADRIEEAEQPQTPEKPEEVTLACPSCQAVLSLGKQHLGIEGACPQCETPIVAFQSSDGSNVRVLKLETPEAAQAKPEAAPAAAESGSSAPEMPAAEKSEPKALSANPEPELEKAEPEPVPEKAKPAAETPWQPLGKTASPLSGATPFSATGKPAAEEKEETKTQPSSRPPKPESTPAFFQTLPAVPWPPKSPEEAKPAPEKSEQKPEAPRPTSAPPAPKPETSPGAPPASLPWTPKPVRESVSHAEKSEAESKMPFEASTPWPPKPAPEPEGKSAPEPSTPWPPKPEEEKDPSPPSESEKPEMASPFQTAPPSSAAADARPSTPEFTVDPVFEEAPKEPEPEVSNQFSDRPPPAYPENALPWDPKPVAATPSPPPPPFESSPHEEYRDAGSVGDWEFAESPFEMAETGHLSEVEASAESHRAEPTEHKQEGGRKKWATALWTVLAVCGTLAFVCFIFEIDPRTIDWKKHYERVAPAAPGSHSTPGSAPAQTTESGPKPAVDPSPSPAAGPEEEAPRAVPIPEESVSDEPEPAPRPKPSPPPEPRTPSFEVEPAVKVEEQAFASVVDWDDLPIRALDILNDPEPLPAEKFDTAVEQSLREPSLPERVEAAEKVVERFLEAPTVDEKLTWIMNAGRHRESVERFYELQPMFDGESIDILHDRTVEESHSGWWVSVFDLDLKAPTLHRIFVVHRPGGKMPMIDWPLYLQFRENGLHRYLAPPAKGEPGEFRVMIERGYSSRAPAPSPALYKEPPLLFQLSLPFHDGEALSVAVTRDALSAAQLSPVGWEEPTPAVLELRWLPSKVDPEKKVPTISRVVHWGLWPESDR